MSLTASDVQRLATLVRIDLEAAEAARTLEQLNAVFGLIERLQSVDTTGVEPMTHARDLVLRLREDVVTEPDRRTAYQESAPAVEDGLYLVPQVIE
ncbi:MAG: Asp-tRNA(Asn)/Glu-tRNA(Gln) amidotransferase subunit GatC [Gammaproteobacteria bacterium]